MCRYVHVLVQKMSVNADLGFILSLVDFFALREPDAQLEVTMATGCGLVSWVWEKSVAGRHS